MRNIRPVEQADMNDVNSIVFEMEDVLIKWLGVEDLADHPNFTKNWDDNLFECLQNSICEITRIYDYKNHM